MSKTIWGLFLAVALLTMALGTVGVTAYNGDFFYIFRTALDWFQQVFLWIQGLFENIFSFFGGVGEWFNGVGQWFADVFGSNEGWRGGR